MKVTVTVLIAVVLVCLMALGAVACGYNQDTAAQPVSHPTTTVMEPQTGPT